MNNFLLPFTGVDSINLAYFIQDQVQEYNKNTRMVNTNIYGVYGSFNNIIWNGGRTIDNGINNIQQISQV